MRGDEDQLLDKSGKRATGVSFVDTSGEEWEQPAELVILCAFQLFNVQLLMLSGIGRIYDPNTGDGQIGRNFSHQTISTAVGFFDKDKFNFNPFIASGAIGMCIDEFNGDNFDHSGLLVLSAGARASTPVRPTAGRSRRGRGGAARHAALGRAVEAGDQRDLASAS